MTAPTKNLPTVKWSQTHQTVRVTLTTPAPMEPHEQKPRIDTETLSLCGRDVSLLHPTEPAKAKWWVRSERCVIVVMQKAEPVTWWVRLCGDPALRRAGWLECDWETWKDEHDEIDGVWDDMGTDGVFTRNEWPGPTDSRDGAADGGHADGSTWPEYEGAEEEGPSTDTDAVV